MNNNHPYIKYAIALLINENSLNSSNEIKSKMLKEQINIGLEHFRISPIEFYETKKKVKFSYCRIDTGNVEKGIFLSTNIITTDMLAKKNTWNAANNLVEKINDNSLERAEKVTMSLSPLSGEFLSFSLKNGIIGRGKPQSTLIEMALSLITTLTPYKPCMQDNGINTTIIPDLPIEKMIDFIRLFKDMLSHNTSMELYYGKVKEEKSGNEKNPTITYKPLRPLLFNGNFPNPPKSTALGAIALLATIGEFAKEAEYSVKANKVLNSLKETTMYLIKYGDAQSYTYNNHVIELAKEGNLRQVVDSIYYSKLYSQPEHARRDSKNTDYQKFDLFTARFLQLFNKASFKDFLAFRAEYPYQLKILFKTYFIKMEQIDSRIVSSARQLGKWLNQVAYFTAKAEIKEGSQNIWEKLREQKAKVLIELESAAFSAKSGDALMAQVITRAGRLSMMDVPPKADLFIESAINGELTLEQSKNLIIAFSRLDNSSKKIKTDEIQEVSTENSNANYENI